MDKLDLSKCETNEEVSKLIKERVLSIEYEELLNSLKSKFVFQDETIRKLYVALSTGNNVILYGHGGFSKSAITKAFCEELGIPYFTKVGYKDMDIEQLLGVPDMKSLLEESKYITSFEQSIFSNKGIGIFEEFGDVRESVLSGIKDILTEKGFREGDLKKESFLSNIIITSNKDPKDLINSDASAALYNERFRIRHNTVWDDFSKDSYLKFIKTVKKEIFDKKPAECEVIAELCSNTESIVSPRVCSSAIVVMDTLGLEWVDTIEDIDTSSIESYKEKLRLTKQNYTEKEKLSKLNALLDSIDINSLDKSNYVDFNAKIVHCDNVLDTDIIISDDILKDIMGVRSRIESIKNKLLDFILSINLHGK